MLCYVVLCYVRMYRACELEAVLRAILEDPDFVPLRRVFPKPLLSSEHAAGGPRGKKTAANELLLLLVLLIILGV